MLLALAPLCAHALTSHRSAVGLDLGAGLGVTAPPVRPAGGGQLSLGFFRGQFDDQFSFGRYWWVGPTGRVDYGADGLRIAPMLDLRRGLDLLVAGVSYGLSGGAVLAGGELGWTVRAAGGAKLRRTRTFSFGTRLEAGVDVVGGRASFAGGVLLGFSLARPTRAVTDPTVWTTPRDRAPAPHGSPPG